MNLNFLKGKGTTNSRQLLQRAIAKNSSNLSLSGKGPVADWMIVLCLGGVLLAVFLWHGWYSYEIQSAKGFGPSDVEVTEAASRTGVAEALNFISQRAAVAPTASLPPVPPPAPIATSSAAIEVIEAFDAPVPGLR
jgi:hypothetical protein